MGASPTLKTQALRQTTTHDNHLPRPSGDGAGPSSETAELTRARRPRCWPKSGDGRADLSKETVGWPAGLGDSRAGLGSKMAEWAKAQMSELVRARRRRSWPGLGDGRAGQSSETAVLARDKKQRSWPELGDGGADPGLETVEQVRAPRRRCWPETRNSGADRSRETAELTRAWKRQSESGLGDGRAGQGSDTAEVPGLGDEENERFLMEKCLDSVWALVN